MQPQLRPPGLGSGLRTSSNDSRPARPPGFSLIELIVVMAIIVILSVLSQGALSGRKQRSLKAECALNLQKLYVSLNLYASDQNGVFPAATNARTSAQALSILVPRYTSETRSFRCPGLGEQKDLSIENFAAQKIHYSYYMGLSTKHVNAPLLTDAQVNTLSKTNGQKLFSASGRPPGNNHGRYGGNILFTDGATRAAGTNAPFPMILPANVSLLNPRSEP